MNALTRLEIVMAPQLAWVLACAFLQVVVTSANEQHLSSHLLIKREFFPAENKALQQVSYRQILSKSPVICVSYCHSDPNCRSVNYINNQFCELYNVTRAQYPDDFKTFYGSWYYDSDLDTPLFSQADTPLLSVSFNNSNSDSCQKLLEAGMVESGVYTIYPAGLSGGLQVYCDMETDGGGWIVIQRRQDGSVSFDRDWNAYRDGFGSQSGEFWLGNNALRILTESSGNWLLRVNLQDWQDKTAWSKYSGFKITGTYFTLNFNYYDDTSTAGDSLNYHQGKPFSTPDRDHDNVYDNCAGMFDAGWWFDRCHKSLLNGQYYGGSQQPRHSGYGIQWDSWRGDPYSLKSCSMEIKISSIPLYSSCEELLKEGNKTMSGVYTIFPAGSNDGMEVYCDMESDGGGWIVIQRRLNGRTSFNRYWNDYRTGFGDLTTEFWLGNDDLRTLTESVATWTLRVDLMDWDRVTAWSEYSGFQITGSYYTLKYSSFDQKSTAGDSLVYHRGSPFSTRDRDNQDTYYSNCAYTYGAGWWFKDCYQALLNGRYYTPGHFISKYDIRWDTWRDNPYSLKECSMKIRILPLPNSQSYSSCTQLLQAGYGVSGIYTIFPAGFSDGLKVYCDMETDGGGWIVFQRRQDGQENFYRSWNDYRAGFGSLSGEFWLGNEKLRILTKSVLTWRLRVDLQDWDNKRAWAIYSGFQITGNYYTLQYNSYENRLSTAGNIDSLLVHKGMPFSTGDRDHDRTNLGNCAEMYKGGWWFNDCHYTLLNGQYYQFTPYFTYARGVQWYYWRQYPYSLKSCSMKIKHIQNSD